MNWPELVRPTMNHDLIQTSKVRYVKIPNINVQNLQFGIELTSCRCIRHSNAEILQRIVIESVRKWRWQSQTNGKGHNKASGCHLGELGTTWSCRTNLRKKFVGLSRETTAIYTLKHGPSVPCHQNHSRCN